MSKTSIWSSLALLVVIVAIVLVVLLMPSNSSKTAPNSSTSLSSAQKTAATSAAVANFEKFFSASTPMSERQALLQNGSQFASVMNQEFAQLAQESPSVAVNSSTLSDSSTVKVNYTINLNGQPVLKDQSGEVLKVNGTWVVSDSTLCQLLSLAGNPPTQCNNVH